MTSPHGPNKALARAGDEIARVSAGKLKSAVLDEEGFKIRLVAVGRSIPYDVLATTRRSSYSPLASEAIAHVADILTLLLPVLTLDSAWFRVQQAATEVQVAILQLLMGGQVAFARRAAATIAAPALAETVRVCIVECPDNDREEVAHLLRDELQAPSGANAVHAAGPEPYLFKQALLVPCPAFYEHLIMVVPADLKPVTSQGPVPLDVVLRDAISNLPGHYVGISEAVSLAHTADAYRDAGRALSVAHHIPERVWQYNSHAEVTDAVEQEAAHRWAEAFLQPLFNLSRAERDHLFLTVRLALGFPVIQVAKVLDVHRNTVPSRVKKAGDLLRLDLNDIQSCAVLDLALQIDAATPVSRRPEEHQRAENLKDVLTAPSVRAWAERALAPLGADERNLRQTLRAWFSHNANADCAAAELGVHPQTVRGHLRRAGRLLQRPLLSNASGCHDVLIALFVLGDLPRTAEGCGVSHSGFFDRFQPEHTESRPRPT